MRYDARRSVSDATSKQIGAFIDESRTRKAGQQASLSFNDNTHARGNTSHPCKKRCYCFTLMSSSEYSSNCMTLFCIVRCNRGYCCVCGVCRVWTKKPPAIIVIVGPRYLRRCSAPPCQQPGASFLVTPPSPCQNPPHFFYDYKITTRTRIYPSLFYAFTNRDKRGLYPS